MKTYIPNNHTRREYLVANSIHKEYLWSLDTFDIRDIYEIAFNKWHQVAIVLDETKLQAEETKQFLQEFTSSKQNKTKLILLSDTKISHPNIFCLPSSVYKIFNEYYQPKKISTNPFILCHLDTTNHKRNTVIQNIVYPHNKNIAVRLVGHPGIQHIQNVGMVSEDQMLDLIWSCSLYVNISNEYIYDAILYNKRILSAINNEYVPSSEQDLQLKDAMSLLNSNHNGYENNLKQHKISNIVKSIVKL
jgi:hypothetical protein